MGTTIAVNRKKTFIDFTPDIDHLEALGTQIQWEDKLDAESGTVLLKPHTDGPPIHFHPLQAEEFYIRQGELMVYKKDKWIKLKAGDTFFIPAKTPHSYKNITAENVLFDFHITPRVRFKEMIGEIDRYVQQGKISGTNFRSILYLCRVMAAFPDVTQSVKPPQPVVKMMAAVSKIFLK